MDRLLSNQFPSRYRMLCNLERIQTDFETAPDGPEGTLASAPNDQVAISVARTLKPPLGPFKITYGKDPVLLYNNSLVSPDYVHSLPDGKDLHIVQDYLPNSDTK